MKTQFHSPEVLESRYAPATFAGDLSAVFDHPTPGGATVTGLGTSHFTWGEGTNCSGLNSFDFSSDSFRVDSGEVFTLGELEYFNGTTTAGTEVSAIDIVINLDLSRPDRARSDAITYSLGMTSTPNTADPEASADFVSLGGGQSTVIKVGNKAYGLEILGFSTDGTEASLLPSFHVREGDSASAELLARFSPLPDLETKMFSYKVKADASGDKNGPIPVGSNFSFNAVIENLGIARAEGFKVGLYLSTDDTFDSSRDFLLAEQDVASLQKKSGFHFKGETSIPLSVPSQYHGDVYLGIIVDSADGVAESDEENNRDQGNGKDLRGTELYDPIAERGLWQEAGQVLKFKNRGEATDFLTANGFTQYRLFDAGWTRPLSTAAYSHYTGDIEPAGFFRIQVGIDVDKHTKEVRLVVQGAEAGFNPGNISTIFGEPSPPYAVLTSPSLIPYVHDYHRRF